MTFQDKINSMSEGLKRGWGLYQHESRTDPETGFPLLDVFNEKISPEIHGWKKVSTIQGGGPTAAKKVKRNVAGKE